MNAAARFGLAAPLFLIGCKSSYETKMDAVMEHLKNRPKTGYLRVVNLTGGTASVNRGGRPICADVPSGAASRLVPVGSGKINVMIGVKSVNANMKPDEGTSIIGYSSGTFDEVDGEMRVPNSVANVRVYFVDGDRSANIPKSGILVTGTQKLTLNRATSSLKLSEGSYQVGDGTIEIKAKFAYSFIFTPLKGRLKSLLLLNTPSEKPGGVAASAN